jgi:AP-3 complex subunit mu
VPPIICASKYFLISICKDGYFLLAVTTNESAPLLIIEMLHRIYATLQEYFGVVDEGTIKDHFCTVYQLLEEMIDYGYALTTEPNALKAMIEPPSVMSMITQFSTGKSNISDVLPDGTLSNTPWRTLGLKYSQNEIYVDIVEEIDATLDCDGNVVSTEVSGSIECNCHMTGMPDLNLEFTNPSVIDDCSFHPCVRYNRYEKSKVVSFVPPDGVFQLMRYRVVNTSPVVVPCYCQPQFHSYDKNEGECQINLLVGLTATHSLIYPPQKGVLEVRNPLYLEEYTVCLIVGFDFL